MPTVTVPFGEYAPDLPDMGRDFALKATNCLPHPAGYVGFPSFEAVSTAGLTARCQGAFFGTAEDGSIYPYAGDATKLYQMVTGYSFSDVSRLAGGAYTVASAQYWEFAQWGQTVIAVNGADAAQTISLGAANFAALGGSPPTAFHIDVVRDFVVMGNVVGSPSRVQWSAIGDAADWTPSAATQSDYQDIQNAGRVQRIFGGEYGLVFADAGIWRMTYVGGPVIFQFDQIERKRGLYAPQAAAALGSLVFYLSYDGFYVSDGSGQSRAIGDGKVDKTFLADLSLADSLRVTSAVDPIRKIVYWSYPSNDATSGTPDTIICCHWPTQRWATISQDVELLVNNSAALGYTLEDLDGVDPSLDLLGYSLDSPVWTLGAKSMAAFNTSHYFGTFTGSYMAAVVESSEVQHFKGRRAHVTRVRPLVDADAASVRVGYRNRQADSRSYTASSSQSSDGKCDVRNNARYHTYEITTSGNFDSITGVEVEVQPGGDR